MDSKCISFMDKKLSLNNNANYDFTSNIQESDYKTLIVRLKEITSNVALIEKTIFK